MAVLFTVCLSANKIAPKNFETKETPPNGVAISENFFCDKTEVDNIGWREYMDWTKRIFGSESPEYIAATPDTLSWLKAENCLEVNAELYFSHSAYSNYPVVGVTQKQAMDYSKWRSDRVFESMLIREKIIEYDKDQSKENYFTIEMYFNGEIKNVLSDKTVYYYPDYRLPTLDERQIILTYSDSLNHAYFDKCKSKYCSQCKENYPEMWSDVNPCNADSDAPPATRNVQSGCISKKGDPIYNLLGNVAEWTSEDGVAAGGGWKNSRQEILKSEPFRYSDANAWTGFRNICTWKKWEEK